MISTTVRIAAGLGLVLCLVGCGSSPINHYYRLTPASAAIGTAQHPAIGVGPIDIPEFLNRNSLVYSGGDNQLQVIGNERWAEPLGDGVQRVVGLNLAQLLNSDNLSYFPWNPRRAPDYGISVSVLNLDAVAGEAILVADWLVYRPADGTTVAKRISRMNKPLSGEILTASELPAAYSGLFYQLSKTIAEVIRADRQTSTEAITGTNSAAHGD